MQLIPTEFEPTMRRSRRLAELLAIALFVASLLSSERASADVEIDRPNVLFLAVDDLNDWVGCLGGHPQAKTPNIDRLAGKGVLFEQAYCAAPLCHPSRTAIMTGLRPSTTGIYGNRNWFRDVPQLKNWVTIPQYFRQQGYIAWTGGKIYHQPHGKWSDPDSWDEQYSTRMGTQHPPVADKYRHGMRDLFSNKILARLMDWSPIDQSTQETADWKTAEGAAKFLQRRHDKPFFLACGIYRPHLQWYAPRKYFDMHPLDQVQLPPYLEDDLQDIPPRGRAMAGKEFGIIKRHGQWKQAVQGYLAASSFADACVGHVLDALERSPYRKNTIVVLWGDHGYHIGNKDHVAKSALWEQTTRTPLIIYAPGKLPSGAPAHGKTCKNPVSLVDLYPTLLDLCGLPKRSGLDGRSLAPLVSNPNADWAWPAIITHSPHWHGTNHAIRTREFHYIHYSDDKEELYDAQADRQQWKNLADDAQFAAAKAKLKKWLPKTNAEHFRDDAAASRGTAKQTRPAKKVESTRKAPLRADSDSARRKRPNVVLLLADDLGSQDIGCYGGPVKTPALDELAAKGVRFTEFHAGAAVCSPSRATLITGRQHLRTGIYGVLQDHMHNMHLLEREVTIPEMLQQAGYGTAHFGKWHIGMTSGKRKKPSPTEHGFDYWFGLSNGAHPSHKNPVNFLRNGKRVGPLKGYSCQLIVDDAIRWLDEKKNPDQPFFLNLWFNEPHHKLAAPDDIVSLYGDLKDEAAIYSATVDNTDRAIGRLVAQLKAMGKLDNTLIIYSSDHGSYRSDRNGGLKGNKGSNFQGGLRSPGIFFWPDGFRGGRTEDTPSGSVDLLPTICGLIGIDKPAGVHLDGADLSPMLTEKGSFKRDQPLLWLAPSSGHLATLREGDYTLMGYRGYQLSFDRVRYNDVVRRMAELSGIDPSGSNLGQRVSNTTFSSPEFKRLNAERVRLQTFQEAWIPTIKKGGFSRFALYDLSTDPLQQKDISRQRPEVTARLTKKLLELYKDVMADAPVWEPVADTYATQTATPKNSPNAKLLAKIDRTGPPKGYRGGKEHQKYVDQRMAELSPQQRVRVGQLFNEKRRLNPKMPNGGLSFVKILEYVAAGEVPDVAKGSGSPEVNWHQWRGPDANGVSRTAKPPLEWNEDRNIKWKVAIKGQGNASPIVWGNKVFILTAINTGRVDPSRPKPEDQPKRVFGIKYPNTFYKFEVVCLDRNTGKELWRRTAREYVPHEGTHHDADFASASPTTDGQRVYCWFGSAGMYCYDLQGKKQWERDLGKARVGASLGEGCSPVVHQGKLVIVRDHARQSSIEVLDVRTGKTLWKKDRDERNAWATPRIVEHRGQTQVITAASKMIRSYDLDSGDIIWQCSGLTGNVTPCPIVDGDAVYCMSGYQGYSLLALPLNARGDISNSDKILWSRKSGTPYVPSAVLYDRMLYFTQSNRAILTAVDSRTGDTLLTRTRIPGLANIYSSPVAAAGRVYFTGRNGTTVVLKRTNKLEVLATNKLKDEFNASAAIAGRQLFLRGRKSLYCLQGGVDSPGSKKSTSIEKQTRIHRLSTTKRSTFDAFSYINRIPEKPYDDETAVDFAGRIFGRLANQEGRVLIKAPVGMHRLAYDGFKTFLRYEGSASVGNCAACHAPADFTDRKSHVVSKDGTAKPTPSLRNLAKRRVDLRKVLLRKLNAARRKQSGAADEISDGYSGMKLSERDIPGLVAFLKLLEDVSDDRFRTLVLEAKVLDTSEESAEQSNR